MQEVRQDDRMLIKYRKALNLILIVNNVIFLKIYQQKGKAGCNILDLSLGKRKN